MVGHMIGEWSRVNRHFKSLGLNVPTILAQDLSAGFILMDDFGNETIADKGMDAYLKAVDVLITMRDHPQALNFPLKKYEDTHVYKALRFYPQYILGDESLTDAWFTAWKTVEESLPPCPRALTHIDFAAMNLMWVNGIDIGIIDFQAACDGPFVYDIVNLLEDIRRDIPQDIKDACIKRYKENLSLEYQDLFDAWYPVITAQFQSRVLGQIQFLSQTKGRDDLMAYFNPLRIKLEKTLQHNVLSPILRMCNKG
jgi:aminoglycoside/choline kinase family phosphotransferase